MSDEKAAIDTEELCVNKIDEDSMDRILSDIDFIDESDEDDDKTINQNAVDDDNSGGVQELDGDTDKIDTNKRSGSVSNSDNNEETFYQNTFDEISFGADQNTVDDDNSGGVQELDSDTDKIGTNKRSVSVSNSDNNEETFYQNTFDEISFGAEETNDDPTDEMDRNENSGSISEAHDAEQTNPTSCLLANGFPSSISPLNIKYMISNAMSLRFTKEKSKHKRIVKGYRTTVFVFRKHPNDSTVKLYFKNIERSTKVFEYLKSNPIIESFRVTAKYVEPDDNEYQVPAKSSTYYTSINGSANFNKQCYLNIKTAAKQYLVVEGVPDTMHPKVFKYHLKRTTNFGADFFTVRNKTQKSACNMYFQSAKASIDMYHILKNFCIMGNKLRVRVESEPDDVERNATKRHSSENTSYHGTGDNVPVPAKKIRIEQNATPPHPTASTSTPNIDESSTSTPNIDESSTSTPNIDESSTSTPNIDESTADVTSISSTSTSKADITSNYMYKRKVWKKVVFHNETFGLRQDFLDELGITLPLGTNIRVGNMNNLITEENEEDLRRVFSMAGEVRHLRVIKMGKKDSTDAETIVVIFYDHPVEAVQAISMFHKRVYCGNVMLVYQEPRFRNLLLPPGLDSVGPGLGPKGTPLTGVRQFMQLRPHEQALKELGKEIISELDRSEYFDGPKTRKALESPQRIKKNYVNKPANKNSQEPYPGQANDFQTQLLNVFKNLVSQMIPNQQTSQIAAQQFAQPSLNQATPQPNPGQINDFQTQLINVMQNSVAHFLPNVQTNQIAAQQFAQQSLTQATPQPNFANNVSAFVPNLAQSAPGVPLFWPNLAQNGQIPSFNPSIAQNVQYAPPFGLNNVANQFDASVPQPCVNPPHKVPTGFGDPQSYIPGFVNAPNVQSEWVDVSKPPPMQNNAPPINNESGCRDVVWES